MPILIALRFAESNLRPNKASLMVRTKPSERNRGAKITNGSALDLEPAVSFHRDRHKDFNANYAWVQRPKVGSAKCDFRTEHLFVSTSEIRHSDFAPSFNQSGEGEIRKGIIEAELVDCMNRGSIDFAEKRAEVHSEAN